MRINAEFNFGVPVVPPQFVRIQGAYTPMQAAGILLAMFGAQSVMLTGRWEG